MTDPDPQTESPPEQAPDQAAASSSTDDASPNPGSPTANAIDLTELPAPKMGSDDAPVAVNQSKPKSKAKKPKVVLCPYCGHAQQQDEKCSSCGGVFEPLSRRATQIAMGPWTIRNKKHPFRPGCSYEVLVQMVEGGSVGPMTVLRGPTTRQFWSVARNVPGVAHLLGYCHACGAHVSKEEKRCPSCDAVFRAVKQRNEMGLQFPNRRAAEAAQRSLNRLLGLTPEESEDAPENASADAETLGEDQEQVAAAAAAAPSDQAPESIFEQDAKNPSVTTEANAQHDLLSDILGDAVPTPPSRDASPPPISPPPSESAAVDAAPQRAETPSPLQAGDAAMPHPAALPPRREINWLVIVLVALNVLVAAAVIVFVATRGGEG